MTEVSPVVASLELSKRLRDRRVELGLAVRDVARELGFSPNYWSGVENNRSVLAEERLQEVIRVLALDQSEGDQLVTLRAAAKERAWWNQPLIADVLQQLYGLEAGASRIRIWESLVVTGLLQTPEYSRALIGASRFHAPVNTERLVQVRMQRQERLDGVSPLQLQVVLGQATLLQHVGEPQVLLGQLRHLADLGRIRSATIEIRVFPFSRPPAALTGVGAVHLLDFPTLPTVAYQEASFIGSLITDEATLETLDVCYSEVLESALSPEESLAMIDEMATDLEREIGRP